MTDAIQSYVKGPLRYENIDGTGEIGMAGLYLSFALLSYLKSILAADSMWRHDLWGMLFWYMVVMPPTLLIYWGTKVIKRRVTWSRTGYVVQRRAKLRGQAFAGGAIATVATWYILRHGTAELERTLLLASFVILYSIFAFAFGREHPWKWLVLAFLAAGLAVIARVKPGEAGVLWRPAACFAGFTWLASGGITLYLYIRRTNPPGAETE